MQAPGIRLVSKPRQAREGETVIGERHLHRYLAEFDFRYSNRIALSCDDLMRAEKLAAGIVGKHLTYPPIDEAGL